MAPVPVMRGPAVTGLVQLFRLICLSRKGPCRTAVSLRTRDDTASFLSVTIANHLHTGMTAKRLSLPPKLCNTPVAAAAGAVEFVADGVFLVIVLMIVLGDPEAVKGADRRYGGFAQFFVRFGL